MSDLPNAKNWRFDEIHAVNPERASRLESAGSPDELIAALTEALEASLASKTARFGKEPYSKGHDEYRIVVQFWIGADLFDWCFNASTGYRAHFRASPECGLNFNQLIIEALRLRLESLISSVIGWRLSKNFEELEETDIPIGFISQSMDSYLSKIWPCTVLIDHKSDFPPSYFGAEEVILPEHKNWRSFWRDGGGSWLDVKGAYVGRTGLHQDGKDPMVRASELHRDGKT